MDKQNQKKLAELRVFAEEIRVTTLKELGHIGFGHIGGSMSVVELLAALYGAEMRYDPKNPAMKERDLLIMSKGHAGPALYATLSLKGFFPRSMLAELNQGGGHLPSHCDRNKTPGVDMTTGSLGQGLSVGCGAAIARRLDKSGAMTYVVLGDGECNEGQVWEGANFAAQFKLGNLVCFVDMNGQQLDGYTKDIMDMSNMGQRFADFGWAVHEINGHDIGEIIAAIEAAKAEPEKPTAVMLHTIKGNGCSFAAGIKGNHHMNFAPGQMEEALEKAEAVLAAARAAL